MCFSQIKKLLIASALGHYRISCGRILDRTLLSLKTLISYKNVTSNKLALDFIFTFLDILPFQRLKKKSFWKREKCTFPFPIWKRWIYHTGVFPHISLKSWASFKSSMIFWFINLVPVSVLCMLLWGQHFILIWPWIVICCEVKLSL